MIDKKEYSFENLTDKKTHFGDFVHLLEEGNEIVAEHYFLRIKKMLEIAFTGSSKISSFVLSQ